MRGGKDQQKECRFVSKKQISNERGGGLVQVRYLLQLGRLDGIPIGNRELPVNRNTLSSGNSNAGQGGNQCNKFAVTVF
jgi:hypothetical protein